MRCDFANQDIKKNRSIEKRQKEEQEKKTRTKHENTTEKKEPLIWWKERYGYIFLGLSIQIVYETIYRLRIFDVMQPCVI